MFYRCVLKCYALIDLETGKLASQDVGQADFYVRLLDARCVEPNDNPNIGIVLYADRDEAVARYSALADSKGVFAPCHLSCLPSEEELARTLETTYAFASAEAE